HDQARSAASRRPRSPTTGSRSSKETVSRSGQIAVAAQAAAPLPAPTSRRLWGSNPGRRLAPAASARATAANVAGILTDAYAWAHRASARTGTWLPDRYARDSAAASASRVGVDRTVRASEARRRRPTAATASRVVERETGLEPATCSLEGCRSAN